KAAAPLWPNNLTNAQVEDKIPGAVFKAFTQRNVKRFDGTPLKYYGKWTTTTETTEGLLRAADGQCDAWANFFLDALKVHGLTYSQTWGPIRSGNWSADPMKRYDEWFLVNDWTFITNPKHGYKPTPNSPLVYDWQNTFSPQDILPLGGFSLKASRAANSYQF